MATHRMTANAESLAIKKPAWGRKMQQRPMRRRRTNHEKDYSVAQESACSGGMHARWRGGSPGDDHISKSTFKARCWETQIDFIQHFDLERITTGADDAFVKYLCHTKNGKSLRNVEYLRIRNGKLESMECYFGAQSSFPSAVSAGQP